MILLLSPAKRLDYESAIPADHAPTQPRMLNESAHLIKRLRELSPAEIASLMSLSDPLAALNYARYAEWHLPFDAGNARPAVFAFAGDVYEGLSALQLSSEAQTWLQSHVRILSGLYGLLRPFDLMQAYRLEMGTRLSNERGRDLYAFWGNQITHLLNDDLRDAKASVVVNLASEEYFKSVKPAQLDRQVIQPVFEDWKAGRYKIISFFAKRARGLMTRYAADRGLTEVDQLKEFDSEGYAFAEAVSDETTWVFRRKVA